VLGDLRGGELFGHREARCGLAVAVNVVEI
jgi:hypothetical protein